MTNRTMHSAILAVSILLGVAPAMSAEPPEVEVTLSDHPDRTMSLNLSTDRVRAGGVKFIVRNVSPGMVHEFLIAKWKGALPALPFDAGTKAVDEDRLQGLQGIEDMPPGHDATVRLVLAPGDYVVFCNAPGHYRAGMAKRLSVGKSGSVHYRDTDIR